MPAKHHSSWVQTLFRNHAKLVRDTFGIHPAPRQNCSDVVWEFIKDVLRTHTALVEGTIRTGTRVILIKKTGSTHSESKKTSLRTHSGHGWFHSKLVQDTCINKVELMQNSFRIQSEHTQTTSRTHSELVQEEIRVHSELIQKSAEPSSELIHNWCRTHAESILNSRTQPELMWSTFSRCLISFGIHSELIQASFRILLEFILNRLGLHWNSFQEMFEVQFVRTNITQKSFRFLTCCKVPLQDALGLLELARRINTTRTCRTKEYL